MKNSRIIHFYIDDTGTKEKEDANTLYFAYAGIAVEAINENTIINKIRSLKYAYFDAYPELKSNWLRIPRERQKHYLEPYGLTDDKLTEFTTALFKIVCNDRIRCLGAIISKEGLQKHYKKIHFDPSPICYEFLLQRVANFSTQYKAEKVNIIMDDMTGKNLTGTEWKSLLEKQHRELKAGKSPYYKNWRGRNQMNYSCICSNIEFRDSASDELIQIADLCAYNIFAQARKDWNNFDNPPFYHGYEWINEIMHRDLRSKRINRFGVVCYPASH